jgi:hypothetical protein
MSKRPRSKNALKHGAYSRELILPGESVEEYEALLADLMAEWMPSGPTERDLVHRLASLFWRKRRQEVYEQAGLEQRRKLVQIRNNAIRTTRR